MRLREPFQAFKLASGHFIVHAGLLVGNLVINGTEEAYDRPLDEIEGYYNPVTGASLDDCVMLVRYAHILCIAFQLASAILTHYECNILATTI
jgi:hypothetical protein